MTPKHRAFLAVLGCALSGSACFDVQEVDVGGPEGAGTVIDDFEDGDLTPRNSDFADWECGSFFQDGDLDGETIVPCMNTSPGFASAHALSLPFDVRDELDGIPHWPGAFAWTPTVIGTLDFGSFTTISFDAKLELASAVPAAGPTFLAEFQCRRLERIEDTGEVPLVQHEFPVGSEWSSHTLRLQDFETWELAYLDTSECLSLVDAMTFVVDALAEGEAARGTLSVDNVVLR